MLSMHDMFYGEAEPVWIMMREKEDSKKADNRGEVSGRRMDDERADYSVFSSTPYYPYYYQDYAPPPAKEELKAYVPPPAKKEEPKAAENKETTVVMKVPICCQECEELVENALYRMKGVKAVECNSRRERVTVVATTAAPADILKECKKVFRKSRMLSDNY